MVWGAFHQLCSSAKDAYSTDINIVGNYSAVGADESSNLK